MAINRINGKGDERDINDEWEEIHEITNEEESLKCLLCTQSFNATTTYFLHLNSSHGWDLLGDKSFKSYMRNQYSWIRFVNFCRKHLPGKWNDVFLNPDWLDENKLEMYLKPVLENDSVLMLDVESLLGIELEDGNCDTKIDLSPAEENVKLKESIEILSEQLIACRRLLNEVVNQPVESKNPILLCDSESKHCLVEESLGTDVIIADNDTDSDDDEIDDSGQMNGNVGLNVREGEDESYFLSYSHYGIHAEMITDEVRTGSYRDFILRNAASLFAGRCILDVGAGSCILSLFAAQTGAKQVYAVEASAEMFAAGCETLRENKMEKQITLLHDRAELVQLPVDKVDVVISEWMGHFLLYESMLESVLSAAYRFGALLPDGSGGLAVYPRHHEIHLVAVQCSKRLRRDGLDLWRDVYGYRMPSMRRAALADAHVVDVTGCYRGETEPAVVVLTPQSAVVYSIDLGDARWAVPDIARPDPQAVGTVPFRLEVQLLPPHGGGGGGEGQICGDGSVGGNAVMDAIVGYFDVRFDDTAEHKVAFSTGPTAPPTHWKQTLFFLNEPVNVKHGDVITGSISITRARGDKRGLEVKLRLETPAFGARRLVSQTFMMAN